MGENVGAEMNGKNTYFRRPVLILRKLDRYSFLAVPLTSKLKEGSWYVHITHGHNTSSAVISQVRNFDYRRLDKRMGTLDESDYKNVVTACTKFISKEI